MLVYITTASKGTSNRSYVQRHRRLLKQRGYRVVEADIEKISTPKLREIVFDADAMFVEGGNTFYLLRAFRRSGFARIVRAALNRGVLYSGSSAGAYVVCPSIVMATWKPKQRARYGVKAFRALNLVPFLVSAHYEPSFKPYIEKGMARTHYPVRVLKDSQGILIEGKRVRFLGTSAEVQL